MHADMTMEMMRLQQEIMFEVEKGERQRRVEAEDRDATP